MKRGRILLLGCLALVVIGAIYGAALIRRGFAASEEPSGLEKLMARAVRNLSIPRRARKETNPWKPTPENLQEGRDHFLARCAICHGTDGSGVTPVGRNLYPKPPDLGAPETQDLTDGQIHYIIQKGVRLTGMPAWGNPHDEADKEGWKLLLFIRSLRPLSGREQSQEEATARTAHYTGSQASAKCHHEIYDRWKETPMAKVVRDPREHPDAILANLASDPFAKFSKDQVALVYGSIWKQRYFTRIGDDYYPEPAQWDVTHHVWRPYFVAKGTDWWEPFYPPDNMQRPTGPTCDGCHSVDYDIRTSQVAEWNVGCERCHRPGSAHAADATRGNIINPAHMDYVNANDTCIQCHSQDRPVHNPMEGKYYDRTVRYRVGLHIRDFWQLEEHTHHKKGSTGSQCVACHMPKIATTLGDVKVRVHTFAVISPALTDKYQIPNPCTSCHTDRTTAWALEALGRWPERSPWRLE